MPHLEARDQQRLARYTTALRNGQPDRSIVYHVDRGDIFKVHQALGGKFCLSGGIPNTLLSCGTPAEVRALTDATLERGTYAREHSAPPGAGGPKPLPPDATPGAFLPKCMVVARLARASRSRTCSRNWHPSRVIRGCAGRSGNPWMPWDISMFGGFCWLCIPSA